MCMSCGCGMPYDDHGKTENITYTDLEAACEAGNVNDVSQVTDNINNTLSQMKRNPGSTIQKVPTGYGY